jgi:hypothetical protein
VLTLATKNWVVGFDGGHGNVPEVTGKSVEDVVMPVTYALPRLSIANPVAVSDPLPERYVE